MLAGGINEIEKPDGSMSGERMDANDCGIPSRGRLAGLTRNVYDVCLD
jgi:hypothetical protein